MANNFYPCISTADLKTINGADLNNNDIALVATSDSAAVYYLSATSGVTESLPTIVAPTSNAGAKRWLMTLSTGWEGGMLKIVTQTAHGFVVGDVLYNNAGTYEKAIATSEPTAEVIGIVSSVLDSNHFYLLGCGYITGLSGLTAGTVYFLSTTVAGATQATEPTTDGEISKPILIADSTTTAYFVNMRGVEIGDTTTLFVSDEAYGATWDNETTIAPSQNAVYDKIESIGGALISDTTYAASWYGVTGIAPSKNAVYDKINGMISDITYAASWDSVTDVAPSKHAVYDKIEGIGGALISDAAYGSGWDGVTTIAPSKNAVYNKIELLVAKEPSDTAYGASWDNVTTIPPSKNAVYDKLQLMSALFPAVLGAANLKQFMNAAGTAPEWANGFKNGAFSRDMTADSGDVAYTGIGFKPSLMVFCAVLDTCSFCLGFDNGTTLGAMYIVGPTPTYGSVSTRAFYLTETGGVYQSGKIKTLDEDGFTLTWVKLGSPAAGAGNVHYIAFR